MIVKTMCKDGRVYTHKIDDRGKMIIGIGPARNGNQYLAYPRIGKLQGVDDVKKIFTIIAPKADVVDVSFIEGE